MVAHVNLSSFGLPLALQLNKKIYNTSRYTTEPRISISLSNIYISHLYSSHHHTVPLLVYMG